MASAPQCLVDDLARFLEDPLEMLRALQALGVDLVDVLGARGGRRTSRAATTLRPPIGASLPGAAVSIALIGSPASALWWDLLGGEPLEPVLLLRRGGDVDPAVDRIAEAVASPA